MDSVPDSAACNEAVKLANKRKFANLKGFVNGVLRKIAANKEQLPMPQRKDEEQYLSVKYSVPEWLVRLWLETYDADTTEKILEAALEIHPVSVRFRTNLTEKQREEYIQKWQKKGVKVQENSLLPYMYTLENVDGVTALDGFEEGNDQIRFFFFLVKGSLWVLSG